MTLLRDSIASKCVARLMPPQRIEINNVAKRIMINFVLLINLAEIKRSPINAPKDKLIMSTGIVLINASRGRIFFR